MDSAADCQIILQPVEPERDWRMPAYIVNMSFFKVICINFIGYFKVLIIYFLLFSIRKILLYTFIFYVQYTVHKLESVRLF